MSTRESWPLELDLQERPVVSEANWEYTLIEYRQVGEEVRPVYETGWGSRRVGPNQEIEVHETNNLLINFIQAKEVREERKVNSTAPLLGRARDFYDKKGALKIFNTFEDHYPELHAKLLDFNHQLTQPNRDLNLYTERDITVSYAWEIIAAIAKALYPEFDIHSLTV